MPAARPGPEEQPKLLHEYREGPLLCRLFESKDPQGVATTFFTVGREGEKAVKQLVGGINDLKRTRALIEKAEAELSRRESREWYPAVQAVRLIEGGAICRVEKSLPNADKAELFVQGTPLAVFPRPSDSEVKKGTELVIRYGDDKRIDLQIRQLRWREENRGQDFAFGRWHDRGTTPQVGDRVNIEALHDYQGEPKDHRITPLTRSAEPGEPKEALYVVTRRDPKVPGLAVVEAITRIRADAIRGKDDLQAGLDARRQASHNRQWHEQDFSPELRQFGPEGGSPQPAGGAAAATPPARKPIVVGSLKAQVFEASDAAGTRHRTVKITRTKDGVEQSFECDLRELLAVAREAGGTERAKGQVREQLLDTSPREKGPDGPDVEQATKVEPGERRNEPVRPTVDAERPQARDQATPGPEPYRDNKHWIAGVWHGADLPKANDWVRFEQGKEKVEERGMTPVKGQARAPEPGGPARYVVAKVVSRGVAVIEELPTNGEQAARRADALERKEIGKENYLARSEQARRREHRRERGLSMEL